MSRETRSSECVLLQERVFSVKKRFLAMYHRAHAGHIGSSLSCAELLVFLRFAWMRDDDTLVLSKGHAAAALYSLLAEQDRLTQRQIDSFYEDGTLLSALPPPSGIPEIPFATGSLGYGLSLSAGMALGARFKQEDRRFFCVTSDGELDEGSVWEAALFIAHHRLTHVIWVIDRNHLQAIGRTEEVLALEPLEAKLRAFGFDVLGVDGHDFSSLLAAREEWARSRDTEARPLAIVASTVKGNGISFLSDTIDGHYLPMTDAQHEQAILELTRSHETLLNGYRNAS
jgi:transketolase